MLGWSLFQGSRVPPPVSIGALVMSWDHSLDFIPTAECPLSILDRVDAARGVCVADPTEWGWEQEALGSGGALLPVSHSLRRA